MKRLLILILSFSFVTHVLAIKITPCTEIDETLEQYNNKKWADVVKAKKRVLSRAGFDYYTIKHWSLGNLPITSEIERLLEKAPEVIGEVKITKHYTPIEFKEVRKKFSKLFPGAKEKDFVNKFLSHNGPPLYNTMKKWPNRTPLFKGQQVLNRAEKYLDQLATEKAAYGLIELHKQFRGDPKFYEHLGTEDLEPQPKRGRYYGPDEPGPSGL